MTSWDVSYSKDGNNFIRLKTDSMNVLRGNKNKFSLAAPVELK